MRSLPVLCAYIYSKKARLQEKFSSLLLHKNKDIEECDSAWFRFVPPSPLVFAIKIKWWNGFFAGSVGPRAEGEGDKDGCTFQERPLVRSSAKMEPGDKNKNAKTKARSKRCHQSLQCGRENVPFSRQYRKVHQSKLCKICGQTFDFKNHDDGIVIAGVKKPHIKDGMSSYRFSFLLLLLFLKYLTREKFPYSLLHFPDRFIGCEGIRDFMPSPKFGASVSD